MIFSIQFHLIVEKKFLFYNEIDKPRRSMATPSNAKIDFLTFTVKQPILKQEKSLRIKSNDSLMSLTKTLATAEICS